MKSLFQPEYCIMQKAFELGLPKEDIFNALKNSDTVINSGVDVNFLLEN